MPSAAFKALQASLISIEKNRQWSQSPAAVSVLTSAATDTLFEALFVRSVVAFERFLETYFYELALGSYVPTGVSAVPLASFATRPVIVAIVHGNRSFADWLPYDQHTLRRARLFLKDGKPFVDLDKISQKQLTEIITIRHAIAHASEDSRVKFEQVAKPKYSAGAVTPASFLRSPIGSPGSPQDRLEAYVMQLINMATILDPS